MAMMTSIPFQSVQLYNVLWNEARSHNYLPLRWRLSARHQYGPAGKLETLLGLPVYYASDTNPYCIILETDHGDCVEQIGDSDET